MNNAEIGKRIKSVRLRKNMTQQSLAELCGITKSHVSKIENGQATPALATLSNIAKALDSPMTWFIEHTNNEMLSIVKKSDRIIKHGDEKIGYQYETLANKAMMSDINPTIVTVLPEAQVVEPYVHDDDEFIFILSGSIFLFYGEEKHVLNQGDSAYFSGRKPHIFLPNSQENAQVLTIYINSLNHN
ncbi:helix-turn-helix domain-containing protein [Viridibacillus arvi]|uniref:helix-turn-helix domain-containing protein n=1 Tax=Viridibacillus arvi TaxID=263475 RepID=UPI003D03E6EE